MHCNSTVLLYLSNDIIKALNENLTVDLFTIYFSKAFDKMNHMVLLAKLKYYGFYIKTVYFIKIYLTGRSQFVRLSENQSATKTTLDVPQGSVLGPLLFLFYIEDLTTVIETLSCLTNHNNFVTDTRFCER